jgi:hypothetical protein
MPQTQNPMHTFAGATSGELLELFAEESAVRVSDG